MLIVEKINLVVFLDSTYIIEKFAHLKKNRLCKFNVYCNYKVKPPSRAILI